MVESYRGGLPYGDEYLERLANDEHYHLGTFGAKKVLLYDSSGNPLTLSGVSAGSIVSGKKTVSVAGTAERITATPTPCRAVWVSADIGAGFVLAVGDASVKATNGSQQGIVLIPGNQPERLDINDLSLLWVDSQSNNGKLAYAYLL